MIGRAGLVLLLVGEFMIQLDTTIVNVALPSIQRDLGFVREADLAWVVNAYVLMYGGLLILMGRAGDLFGRRRLLMGGVVVFAIASLACGLATSDSAMVLSRGLQGIGAAAIAPAVLSLITSSFPEGPQRARALAAWGTAAGAGAVLGLLFGGVLTDWFDWRWVFLINVPISAAILALAHKVVPESRAEVRPRLDLPGALLITAALVLVVYSTVETVDLGWSDPRTVAGYATAALLLVAFILRERYARQPLVRLGLLAQRNIAGSAAVTFLFGTTQFGVMFFLALYLQRVLGLSPLEAGLAFLPFGLAYGAATGMAASLASARGPRVALSIGLLLVAIAQLWLTTSDADGSYLIDVLAPLVLAGAGLGFAYVPLSISATSNVAPDESGLASGLFNTSLQIGGAVGLAVLSTLATARTEDSLAAGNPLGTSLVEGFHDAYLLGSGLALCALLVGYLSLHPKLFAGGTAASSPSTRPRLSGDSEETAR